MDFSACVSLYNRGSLNGEEECTISLHAYVHIMPRKMESCNGDLEQITALIDMEFASMQLSACNCR